MIENGVSGYRIVLYYFDAEYRTGAVPSSSCRPILVAAEDVRVGISNNDFAVHVLKTYDKLESILDEIIDSAAAMVTNLT